MKNKTGTLIGFIIGMAGFLLLFKIIFLSRIQPEDEIPPGAVMLAAVMFGFLFSFIGYRLQNVLRNKGSMS